jgi:hypothetical protein
MSGNGIKVKKKSWGPRAEDEEEIRRELGPSTGPVEESGQHVLERRLC